MNQQSFIHGLLIGLLAILLAVVSYFGAFVPGTYVFENTSFSVQGMGQDVFDLFVIAPVLLISFFLKERRNKTGFFLYGGTLFYLLYSFFLYSFGVHFNELFLFYCLILGLSLYTFILFVYSGAKLKIDTGASVKVIGIYLLFIAGLFYAIWLKDIIPSLLNGITPVELIENKLIVNPVHVMDISIALPGLIITSILFMRRHPLGLLLAPVFLVFTILLALSLVSMAFMLKSKGVSEDLSLAVIFVILAVISTIFLLLFLRDLKISH